MRRALLLPILVLPLLLAGCGALAQDEYASLGNAICARAEGIWQAASLPDSGTPAAIDAKSKTAKAGRDRYLVGLKTDEVNRIADLSAPPSREREHLQMVQAYRDAITWREGLISGQVAQGSAAPRLAEVQQDLRELGLERCVNDTMAWLTEAPA